jgi:hypothetical protein
MTFTRRDDGRVAAFEILGVAAQHLHAHATLHDEEPLRPGVLASSFVHHPRMSPGTRHLERRPRHRGAEPSPAQESCRLDCADRRVT